MSDLKKYSLISWLLERLFNCIQYFSIANLLFGTRIQSKQQFADPEKVKELTIKRGHHIEIYIIIFFILELLGVFLTPFVGSSLRTAFCLIAAYRIFDIFQASINLNLFDRLRTTSEHHYVASVTRSAILSVWNYIELIICFGIIYSLNLLYLKNATMPGDGYYFSVITQLTIGYGDLIPLGLLRIVAAIQGLLGFLVALFAVSRIIAFLPRSTFVFENK
jgi:hypothetical protein